MHHTYGTIHHLLVKVNKTKDLRSQDAYHIKLIND